MIVRSTFVALAALVLVGATQSAFAQDASVPVEAPEATLTAQVTPDAPEVVPATVVPTSAAPVPVDRSAERCRWQRTERNGLESVVLVPLDLMREALSALRRGTTASCTSARAAR